MNKNLGAIIVSTVFIIFVVILIFSILGGMNNGHAPGYDRTGLCQFKVGGEYVCNAKATNGNYCEYHYNYLNDAYNSLFG